MGGSMALHTIDAIGLKCIAPTLKLTSMSLKIAKGDEVEIVADCKSFEKDLRDWCARNRKIVLWIRDGEGDVKTGRIQF